MLFSKLSILHMSFVDKDLWLYRTRSVRLWFCMFSLKVPCPLIVRKTFRRFSYFVSLYRQFYSLTDFSFFFSIKVRVNIDNFLSETDVLSIIDDIVSR